MRMKCIVKFQRLLSADSALFRIEGFIGAPRRLKPDQSVRLRISGLASLILSGLRNQSLIVFLHGDSEKPDRETIDAHIVQPGLSFKQRKELSEDERELVSIYVLNGFIPTISEPRKKPNGDIEFYTKVVYAAEDDNYPLDVKVRIGIINGTAAIQVDETPFIIEKKFRTEFSAADYAFDIFRGNDLLVHPMLNDKAEDCSIWIHPMLEPEIVPFNCIG